MRARHLLLTASLFWRTNLRRQWLIDLENIGRTQSGVGNQSREAVIIYKKLINMIGNDRKV